MSLIMFGYGIEIKEIFIFDYMQKIYLNGFYANYLNTLSSCDQR